MSRRRKRHRGCLILALLIIVLLAIAGYVFSHMDDIAQMAGRAVVKRGVVEVVTSISGQDVDIDGLMEQMEPEDAQQLEDIIDSYADPAAIAEAAEILQSQDMQAAQQYLMEQVDEGDIQKLQELYEKYKDQIPTGQ